MNHFSNFIIFFEQRRTVCRPRQIVQIETAFKFIENTISVSLYSWLNYFDRWNNGTMERETFVQTIYSWKSTQIWCKDIQASGYYNGYTWNLMVYTSKQGPTAGLGHAQTVVLDLADGLLGCHRTVVVDNFFTSISLAESLLRNDTYLIGTLRSNRAGSEHGVVQEKLKRGEVYGLQSSNGIKLIKWKDKRDVLMISTKLSHSVAFVETGKTNKSNERIMKPQVIVDYNKGKQGADLSDQLSASYTCLQTIWKVASEGGIWDDIWNIDSECLSDLQRKCWPSSYDNTTVSWKSRAVFTSWRAIRESKSWSERTFNKSNETQAGGSQTRRKRRIYAQCWQTVHWLLCEGKDRAVKRSEQRSSKESKNFLF